MITLFSTGTENVTFIRTAIIQRKIVAHKQILEQFVLSNKPRYKYRDIF